MKNFTKLATFLIVFLSFQVATGQNANYKGFELTGKNPLAIQVNQAFSKSSDVITFDGKIAAIYGLAVKANVTFNDSKSAVRIILTDNVGDEYLVYETYPMLEDGNSVTIDNLCEETGVLNGVTPRSLRVEVKNATVTIQSVRQLQIRLLTFQEQKRKRKIFRTTARSIASIKTLRQKDKHGLPVKPEYQPCRTQQRKSYSDRVLSLPELNITLVEFFQPVMG